MKALSWICLGALLLVGGGPAPQDPQELQQLVKTLHEERVAYGRRRRERERQIEEMRAALVGLEAEAAEAKGRREELDGALQKLRDEVKKLKDAEAEAARVRTATAAALEPALTHARASLDAGLPSRLAERRQRLEGDGTPDEALIRYWSFVQEELRLARSGEGYTDSITLADGRVKHAHFVRVGRTLLAYATEDGQNVGFWEGTAWNHAPDLQTQTAIRRAVEILSRRRLPEWLMLPVPAAGARP